MVVLPPLPLSLLAPTGAALLGLHAAYWAGLSVARLRTWAATRADRGAARRDEARAAPGSRLLVAAHGVGFAAMYAGLAVAPPAVVRAGGVAAWALLAAGAVAITAGAVAAMRAMAVLRSWRLRAALAADHQLTTDGVFAVVRHPIYAGLDLLALGTAIAWPTLGTVLGLAGVVLGGDLRARAEERLLLAAYGDTYRAYAARTARLLPGLY